MTRKRGNNEGSIYQRSNGHWRAQVTVEGKRLGYTSSNRAEAIAWVREMGTQVDRGLTLKAARKTYDEFLEEWLTTAKGRLTYESLRSYKQLIKDYVLPELGSVKLRELTPIRIQRLYNRQAERGVGKRTIQKTHAVIRASLNSAMKMGLIASNPSNATNPPKPDRREMLTLSEEQARLLLVTAKTKQAENYALYYLAIVTGMRQGELLALKWPEVDLAKGILQVKFSLKRDPIVGLMPKKPKTKASIRSTRIGADTCKVLDNQAKLIASTKKTAGENWQESGYVFPSRNGSPIEPAEAYRNFQKLLIVAGLPKMRFHDLRHTAASLMLNNGVDVLVASKRLGHAKPSITLDFYGHLLPNIQTKAANVLEGLLRAE